jgi:hypothetical protein
MTVNTLSGYELKLEVILPRERRFLYAKYKGKLFVFVISELKMYSGNSLRQSVKLVATKTTAKLAVVTFGNCLTVAVAISG